MEKKERPSLATGIRESAGKKKSQWWGLKGRRKAAENLVRVDGAGMPVKGDWPRQRPEE